MNILKTTEDKLGAAAAVAVKWLQRAFGSVLFPVITAAVTLICYYCGWDMATIFYIGTCYLLILLFCKDVTPAFCLFLFMDIIISLQNTPSYLIENLGGTVSAFYTSAENLISIIILVAADVTALFYRAIRTALRRSLNLTPMGLGMCFMAFAIALNGIFYEKYTIIDLGYGVLIGLCFAAIYFLISACVTVNKQTFEKIAVYFAVFFIALAFELIAAYFTREGLFANGKINRTKLFFGWGMYNTMGMLLCLCMPALFYLAIIKKLGWIFTALAMGDVVCIILSMSRQSILCGAIMFIICFIWLCVKRGGLYRLINLVMPAALVGACAVVLYHHYDLISASFGSLLDGINSGGGRFTLWQQALANYRDYPAFGVGFFASIEGDPGFPNIELVPDMYHDTLLQMMGSCGTLGLIAYIIHRAQTVYSYAKRITTGRTFLTLSILALVLVSVLDNHLFYFFPTIIYAALTAMLSASQKRNDEIRRMLKKS